MLVAVCAAPPYRQIREEMYMRDVAMEMQAEVEKGESQSCEGYFRFSFICGVRFRLE